MKNHQPPDWYYKYGYSEIIKNQLYLVGEDDVDDLLYGRKEAVHLNGTGDFQDKPQPQVDMWIDLRDIRAFNRQVYIPNEVQYISIPFRDGVLEEAKTSLPKAKDILSKTLKQGQRVMVGCHMGRSRSALLVIWYLAEVLNSYIDAYWKVKSIRPIINIDKNFQPILDNIYHLYSSK